MKSRKFASFFAAAAMLIGVAFSACTAQAGDGTVKFTANINTTEFLAPTAGCPSGMGSVGAGTGKSNLFIGNPDKNTTVVALSMNDCVMPTATTLNFQDGKFTLTGPDGDTITATFTGVLVYQSGDPTTIAVYAFDPYQTQFQITGGTGRYRRATGSGTISGTETVNSLQGVSNGVLFASGTIVY